MVNLNHSGSTFWVPAMLKVLWYLLQVLGRLDAYNIVEEIRHLYMHLFWCFIAQESSFSELHSKRESCSQVWINLSYLCMYLGVCITLKTHHLKAFTFHFGIFNTIWSSGINNHLIYVLLELKQELSALSQVKTCIMDESKDDLCILEAERSLFRIKNLT